MLDKEFVPYQESLELKELGFDEGCFALYNKYGGFIYEPQTFGKIIYKSSLDILKAESVLAPTFSQAFRWFRENYELHHLDLLSLLFLEQKMNYEEAELACLRKLIEIVKK